MPPRTKSIGQVEIAVLSNQRMEDVRHELHGWSMLRIVTGKGQTKLEDSIRVVAWQFRDEGISRCVEQGGPHLGEQKIQHPKS